MPRPIPPVKRLIHVRGSVQKFVKLAGAEQENKDYSGSDSKAKKYHEKRLGMRSKYMAALEKEKVRAGRTGTGVLA